MIRMCDIYQDALLWQMDTKVENGAAKGIYTTKKRAEENKQVMDVLKKYVEDDSTLAVAGFVPWIYLETEADVGAYSTIITKLFDERNESYYQWYPEKIPDVIFLLKPDYEAYTCWRYSSHGSLKGYGEAEPQGWLKAFLEENDYRLVMEECGKIYIMMLGPNKNHP